jgi:UDP-N-acetylmuramoyl-tripeptide--D-alanyl-D-alanine ligase
MDLEILYKYYLECRQIVTIDTRKIKGGEIYFALKGDNFDGNLFAEDAIKKGAKYVIVDDKDIANKIGSQAILVTDVLRTLQELAKFHRLRLNIPIIAITGSNGKTTTKELLYNVLSQKFKTAYTKGNLNNHIGIPLTLLDIKPTDEISIVEMGANHQKEIASYCNYVLPNYGIITNFGKAHLEGFGGIEGVIKGKSELFEDIKERSGIVFFNRNDSTAFNKVKDINLKAFDYSINDPNSFVYGKEIFKNEKVTIEIPEWNLEIKSNLTGSYNVNNILAAICVGKFFEIDKMQIKNGIESYFPNNSRSQIQSIGNNTWILDAYNANPSSMEAALRNLETFKGPKLAILGAMMELGDFSENEHYRIAELASKSHFENVILVGEYFKDAAGQFGFQFAENNIEAKQLFEKLKIDHYTILLKGSRSIALEKLIT